MTDKKEYKLSSQGSLGVLALGDIGLKLWREVREKEGKRGQKGGENNQTHENDGEKTGK